MSVRLYKPHGWANPWLYPLYRRTNLSPLNGADIDQDLVLLLDQLLLANSDRSRQCSARLY